MKKVVVSQRRNIVRISLFFVLLICIEGLFWGCGTTADIPPSEMNAELPHQIPEGKALVYFYYGRKYLFGTTAVELDGKSSLIEKDTYILWEVEPGEHQLSFTFERKWYTKTVEKTITCEPDQQYFYYLYPYTEDDEPRHKILQASSNTGHKKIQQFRLMRWFK